MVLVIKVFAQGYLFGKADRPDPHPPFQPPAAAILPLPLNLHHDYVTRPATSQKTLYGWMPRATAKTLN